MKLLLVLSYIIFVNSFQISSNNHIKRYIKVTMNFNDNGYGLMGSLTRQGPIPVITRVFNSEKYEEAVSNYLKSVPESTRSEAQANADAYFNDLNGYMLNKINNRKIDYLNIGQSKSALALTGIWGININIYDLENLSI